MAHRYTNRILAIFWDEEYDIEVPVVAFQGHSDPEWYELYTNKPIEHIMAARFTMGEECPRYEH